MLGKYCCLLLIETARICYGRTGLFFSGRNVNVLPLQNEVLYAHHDSDTRAQVVVTWQYGMVTWQYGMQFCNWDICNMQFLGFTVDFATAGGWQGWKWSSPTSTDPDIGASRTWAPSTRYTSWIYTNQAALRTGRNWSPSLLTVSAQVGGHVTRCPIIPSILYCMCCLWHHMLCSMYKVGHSMLWSTHTL